VARLIYTGEDGAEVTLSLGPDRPVIVVGRKEECDLRTHNNTVSRIHARFVWENGVVRVVDNRSANGVWVGKERVAEAELEDGEKVFLGAFQVVVRLDPGDLEVREGATEEGPPPLPEVPVVPAGRPGPRGTESWSPAPGLAVSPAPPAPVASPVDSAPSAPLETIGYADVAAPGEADEVVFQEEEVPENPLAPVAAGTPQGVEERARESERRHEEGEGLLRQRVVELEGLLEEARRRQRSLQGEVEDLTRVLERQAAELQEVATLREKVAGLERSASMLEVDGKRLREEAEEAVRRAEEAEAERERLRLERDLLQEERAEAFRRLEDAEARREALEAEAAESRLRVQELERSRDEAREADRDLERIPVLEREIEALQERVGAAETARDEALQRQEADRKAIETTAEERDRLLEEVERWELLKRQFDEDRAGLQVRLEAREREVADLSASLERANAALAAARQEGASAQAIGSELEELKAAHRAALKKVARLMEELEKVQSAPAARESEEVLALQRQVADLQGRLHEVSAERDRLRDLGEQLRQRLASLEAAVQALPPEAPSAPPVAAPAAPEPAVATPAVPPELREIIDRINGALSEFRTGLEVLTGLLPEVLERVPGGAGEDGEQLSTALEDLARLSGELKADVVQVRRLL